MSEHERASRSEEIRVRQKYRALVMRGRLNLPLTAVVRLVGPDCAYHAYRRLAGSSPPPKRKTTGKRR